MSHDTVMYFVFVFGILTFGLWLRVILEAWSFEKRSLVFHRKKMVSDSVPLDGPLVSIIVPARNEEETLADCLKSLSEQNYERFEIIAVNDRSMDRTLEIMHDLALKDSRIKVVDIRELPAGWLGKNHALQKGAEKAEGELLLFTDGDVLFKPETLREAVAILNGSGLDHLVLSPLFPTRKTLLASLQCFFSIIFLAAIRPSQIGRSPDFYIGSGSFNFVRRSAYEKAGTHQRLRLEVLDDVMLGKALVQSGAKQAFVDGGGLVKVEWYKSVSAMIRGLEKNAFASLRYSLMRFLFYSLSNIWFYFLPYVVIVALGLSWQTLPFFASVVLMHLLYGMASFRMGYSLFLFPLLPVAAWILWYIYLRSTFLTLWRGKVVWRETAYSLKDLRENML